MPFFSVTLDRKGYIATVTVTVKADSVEAAAQQVIDRATTGAPPRLRWKATDIEPLDGLPAAEDIILGHIEATPSR